MPRRDMRRRKLWEINARYHCQIIGTCLSYTELYRIARKAGLHVPAGQPAYELHGDVVRRSGQVGRVARLLQKALDKKYAPHIRQLHKADDPDSLAVFWDAAVANGNVAGAYWVLSTHPLLSDELGERAFGDLHMLSHLCGAANRADLKRLRALEIENEELWHVHAEEIRCLRERLAEKDRCLARQDVELRSRACALAQMQQRRFELEPGRALDDTSACQARWERCRDAERERADKASQRSDRLAREVEELQAEVAGVREDLRCSQLAQEDAERAIQDVLASVSVEPCEGCEHDSLCGPVLCGRRVLYVGGKLSLVPHYRLLVERHGGEFIYHDGGKEDGDTRLPALLNQADIVFCALDNVSHAACTHVKRVCKRRETPLILLPSSGVSMVASALRRLSADKDGDAEGGYRPKVYTRRA